MPSLSKIGDLSCITSCLVLPGFLMDTLLSILSFIVDLIVRDAYSKVAHAGRGITLSELRSQYWILSVNSVVRHFISKCVVCRRLRGTIGEQKMADLPRERITSSPPFPYSGVDYFGPFYIKQGPKDVKRYGVLLTCIASRAVHIRTADSLEMDSFINVLRRFIARRGPVREIGWDQERAERELKRALDDLDHNTIQRNLCRDFNAGLDYPMKAESSRSVPYGRRMGAPDTVCQINFVSLCARTRPHPRR